MSFIWMLIIFTGRVLKSWLKGIALSVERKDMVIGFL
jgi:hypothetical protein